MKYIFDFDDVLFYTTKHRKERMFLLLEEVGIPKEISEEYYKKVRVKEFSLKNFITELLTRQKITYISPGDVYEKIMSDYRDFTNIELLQKIETLGKDNCFIVTNGEYEFNKDKIKRSGMISLFSEVYIVPGSKKEVIYEICNKYRDEKITFVEDKVKFIDDIDFSKCPNLKTILYTGQAILP